MSATPRTDALFDDIRKRNGSVAYGDEFTRGWSSNELWDFARQLERELNAALIAAGVASLERGEWATERDDLNQRIREWRDICEKHDAKLTKALVERDAAEEVISEIYFRIMGRSPEWSNLFGHQQAVEEIVETFDTVRACLKVWRKD